MTRTREWEWQCQKSENERLSKRVWRLGQQELSNLMNRGIGLAVCRKHGYGKGCCCGGNEVWIVKSESVIADVVLR